jgi:urease accessory protein
LEAAVQGGAVQDADAFARHVEYVLRNGVARREGVAVARAWSAQARGTGREALDVDWELDAMNLCRETRLASRQMGRQVLRVAGEQFDNCGARRQYRLEVDHGKSPGHLAVVLGMTLGACGWGKRETIAAFLYQTAVGFVSAAMKLLPIGQRDGQRLVGGWLPLFDELSRTAASARQMHGWTPIQDIYAMQHATLRMRLFRS